MDTGYISGLLQAWGRVVGRAQFLSFVLFFYNGKHKKQQQKGIVHRGVWLHLKVSGSGFYCEEAIISEDAFELR